jgi:hypothetical protein
MYKETTCMAYVHKPLKVTATLRHEYIIAVYCYPQCSVVAK